MQRNEGTRNEPEKAQLVTFSIISLIFFACIFMGLNSTLLDCLTSIHRVKLARSLSFFFCHFSFSFRIAFPYFLKSCFTSFAVWELLLASLSIWFLIFFSVCKSSCSPMFINVVWDKCRRWCNSNVCLFVTSKIASIRLRFGLAVMCDNLLFWVSSSGLKHLSFSNWLYTPSSSPYEWVHSKCCIYGLKQSWA